MDYSKIEEVLISEIDLTPIQAKMFLLIVTSGKMKTKSIASTLNIPIDDAGFNAEKLIEFGAFIEISKGEFEAMHPRFTAVNMYRKLCERKNKEFGRNKLVDNIGVVLERPYDVARTK